MKRIFISIAVGTLLTVFLGVMGGVLGGACHCMTPMTLLFPYGTIIVMRSSWQVVGVLLVIIQFPLYVIIPMSLNGGRRRGLALLVLVAVHAAASVLGLTALS
jgi:hypothetical protein